MGVELSLGSVLLVLSCALRTCSLIDPHCMTQEAPCLSGGSCLSIFPLFRAGSIEPEEQRILSFHLSPSPSVLFVCVCKVHVCSCTRMWICTCPGTHVEAVGVAPHCPPVQGRVIHSLQCPAGSLWFQPLWILPSVLFPFQKAYYRAHLLLHSELGSSHLQSTSPTPPPPAQNEPLGSASSQNFS